MRLFLRGPADARAAADAVAEEEADEPDELDDELDDALDDAATVEEACGFVGSLPAWSEAAYH